MDFDPVSQITYVKRKDPHTRDASTPSVKDGIIDEPPSDHEDYAPPVKRAKARSTNLTFPADKGVEKHMSREHSFC